MNPRLGLLQPYPFERLRALLAPPAADEAGAGAAVVDRPRPQRFVNLSIGEPRHRDAGADQGTP